MRCICKAKQKHCLGSAWRLRVSGRVVIGKGPRATPDSLGGAVANYTSRAVNSGALPQLAIGGFFLGYTCWRGSTESRRLPWDPPPWHALLDLAARGEQEQPRLGPSSHTRRHRFQPVAMTAWLSLRSFAGKRGEGISNVLGEDFQPLCSDVPVYPIHSCSFSCQAFLCCASPPPRSVMAAIGHDASRCRIGDDQFCPSSFHNCAKIVPPSFGTSRNSMLQAMLHNACSPNPHSITETHLP